MKLKTLLLLALGYSAQAQEAWKIAGDKILTPWAEQVSPIQTHNEYPRPQLERSEWTNLNGLWDYSILPGKLTDKPQTHEGKILVPYAVESALSGVGRRVGKDSTLWYKRTFELDKALAKDQELWLHFGAVDWKMDLFVNGKKVGEHEGGYDPFQFDISSYLVKGKTQTIEIGVWDPTDNGPQPNGKQVNNPRGIWYTPVTGIWQTVWLEKVNKTHVSNVKFNANATLSGFEVTVDVAGAQAADQIQIKTLFKGQELGLTQFKPGENQSISITQPKLWSPNEPNLYHFEVKIIRGGKIIDEVKTYSALRKISMEKGKDGIQRMLLNNAFVFQYGPLDQGWWPDGLYTAPNDEALKFDIVKTKEMGFNMIRKHIKVEPARWYYYCDVLGMLVWQDMPSGDLGGNTWDMRLGNISGKNLEKERTPASEAIYKKEWKAIIDALDFFKSIVVWVPFNEAWGQFKTREITEWTMNYDKTRLVNSASGGNFFTTGHILDIHHYPEPQMPDPQYFGKDQVLVLGEFGGLGLPLEGHTWQAKNNWGYQSFKNKEDLQKRYQEFMDNLSKLIEKGLSAAVYTQTTDVEIETNGLITYDRKVNKMGEKELFKMHQPLYKPLSR